MLPCPLCNVELFHNSASELGDIYEHPANGCAIQVAWFTATDKWIASWNRRSLPIKAGEAVGEAWFREANASATNIPLYASPQPEAYGVRAAVIEECARIAKYGMQRAQRDYRTESPHSHAYRMAEEIYDAIRALSHTEHGEPNPMTQSDSLVETRRELRNPATASHAESVITAGHLFAASADLQSEKDREGVTSDRS
jgi:hypothetical protein